MSRAAFRSAVRACADRRGTTLLAVLVALAVATVTATAAAALARTLQLDAPGAAAALRARAAAEGGVGAVVAGWPREWTTRLAPGSWDVRSATSAAGAATVRVLRLDGRRYLLTAEGASPALAGRLGAAVRRTALFVQLENVAYMPGAALVAAGPVVVGADAELRAADAAPAGWTDCAAPDTAAVAVAAPSLSAKPGARVVGAVVTDRTAWSPPAVERFGDVDRAALAARAGVVLPAGGSFGPVSGSDFPVVHSRGLGTTELRGPARLQGTLLIDGALTVVGRVEVAGLVVVGGRLDASAGALVVDGAVLVRGGGVSLGPGSRVRRSRCALARAAAAASRPVPLARRAWSDLVR